MHTISLPLNKGAFLFTYDLSIFLTSTAFMDKNAKYGIPLSRYTVFLKTVFDNVMNSSFKDDVKKWALI